MFLRCGERFTRIKESRFKLWNSYADFRFCSALNGTNIYYIEEMYNAWKKDSSSVHKSWDAIFKAQERGISFKDAYVSPFSIKDIQFSRTSSSVSDKKTHAVYSLIKAYRDYGHFSADTNPLEERPSDYRDSMLNLSSFGLSTSDLNETFHIPSGLVYGLNETTVSLKNILAHLNKVYCEHIGVDVLHIKNLEERQWLYEKFENMKYREITAEDKIRTVSRLARATLFEQYLAKKFPSEKRFGLEGCESFIASLKTIIDESSKLGVDYFIMGSGHRGRLNALMNVCRKPLEEMFTRFDSYLESSDEGSGDVKYHLGMCQEVYNKASGKNVTINYVANPSHLEAVNPVALGKTKGVQHFKGDKNGERTLCILIHGDAALSGQGVVYESCQLSQLKGYGTYGSIHIAVNNRIGFTTNPDCSRSSYYCTDVAKITDSPVFHVNADDPDAVNYVSKVASEYRKKFKKDVYIDLVSYRRNGHNEFDNASYTQPLMYKTISVTPNIMEKYSQKLIDEGVLTAPDFEAYKNHYGEILDAGMEAAKSNPKVMNVTWLDSTFDNALAFNFKDAKEKPTGLPIEHLKEINLKCNRVPDDFVAHQTVIKNFAQRELLINQGKIDWALGEISAFGSLLQENVHVRLSGEDVERGTFSHRHHVLHHQNEDKCTFVPLNNISDDQAFYSVTNSALSEYAVLGFDLGYSLASPNLLVCWEAQFGDFVNGAQIIIDQFLASGYTKWLRQTGLTMLLPHGYDGMGPEHSSARLERFLELSSDDWDAVQNVKDPNYSLKQLFDCNWIVVNCTTPANIFHALRRQVHLNFRRPLIVCSPKNLLRLEAATSSFEEMKEGTSFSRVISDTGAACIKPKNVERHILCSGKIFYELDNERKSRNLEDKVAITRVEQISPFPYDLLKNECEKYSKAQVMWVQEEPKNQGAWKYVQLRMNNLLGDGSISYLGRKTTGTTATGSKKTHLLEQESIVSSALTL